MGEPPGPPALTRRLALLERWAGTILRLADRALPPAALRLLLWPAAAACAAYQLRHGGPDSRSFGRLPPSLRPREGRCRWLLRLWGGRTDLLTSKLVRYWPDRLREPRWQGRCRLLGAEALDAVLASGRPVILATVHYGNLSELGHWLRARGTAAAILSAIDVTRVSAYRDRVATLRDQAQGLAEVPRYLQIDNLWDVRDFLAVPNRVLVVAFDAYHRRYVLVCGDDCDFRISTGAFKLAAIVNAVVIPCVTRAPRGLAVEIHLGRPVPDADVITAPDPEAACRHIVREILHVTAPHPEQYDPYFLHHCLVPAGGAPGRP